jgi:uncharacterized protein (TIGR02145 family)
VKRLVRIWLYLSVGILCCVALPLAGFTQTDTEFWFIAPEVSKNGGSNFDIPIYLRISSYSQPSTVTVDQPANPAFVPIVVNLLTNGFSTVDLSPFLDVVENKPANTILNYGLRITATTPVSLYYEVASTYCGCNPELFALKGRNAVGTNFMIPTQNFFHNTASYTPTPYNAFDIVATKDNTIVSITPKKDIVGHAAGVTFNITLNKGQSWSALATSQSEANHLWGSVVTSNNPVAITMTDDLLWGITGCADLIGDQIVPVGITGTDYIAIKGNLTNDGNRAFVMATQDNTDVYVDGNPVPSATLAKGSLFNHNIVNASTLITASHPVYVFQTSGFGCELGGALLPSINCTGSTQVTFTRTTNQSLGLVVTTQTGNVGSFLVNGDASLITAADFSPVPGTLGAWQAANKTFSLAQIPVGTAVMVVNTTGPFQMGLMIGNAGGGCSYGYFSDFARLNLGADLTICPGDSIPIDAGGGWNTYLWNTGATTQSIWVKTPGDYYVTVTDPACTLTDTVNLTHLSPPLVSIGPDHSLCNGTSETLSATGGPFIQYLWSTGATTPTLLITAPGTYFLTVTDNNGCKSTDTVHVVANPGPVITTTPLFKTICSGFPTQISLTSNLPLTTYSWIASSSSPLVTGYSDGTGNTINQVLLNDAASAETVTYSITPVQNGCVGTPSDYIVTIDPTLPVSVSVSATANTVCAGTTVTFTATPTNGGTTPAYQWKVNGINTGSNAPVYAYIPLNNDLISCILTSSEICTTNNPASSTQYPVTVNPNLPVSITVSASANPVCSGTSVTFTATPINGGFTPSYQWKVNGVNAGSNAPIYAYVPANNDLVSCILTSSETCTASNPASSIQYPMTVNPNPSVSFTPCFDTITTSNAKPIKLKGGIPLGGSYSGLGVSAGYYYPSIAGTGTHLITYSYTNVTLCSAAKSSPIHQFTSSPVTCGNSLTDIRDGKIYPTVKIGSQCWFAQDLNYGNPVSSTQHQRDNCIPEKYLQPPPGLPLQGEGSVYQWDELMQYDDTPGKQGLCPPGWHVPSQSEWNTLFATFTNSGFAGSPLKYDGYSGFNALLKGTNFQNRGWYFQDFATFFWSSTSHGDKKAWSHGMNDYNPSVSLYPSLRSHAFSVRCLLD